MKIDRKKTCRYCKWWDCEYYRPNCRYGQWYGKCKRNPRQIANRSQGNTNAFGEFNGTYKNYTETDWPSTNPTDWCGCFEKFIGKRNQKLCETKE